MEPNSAVRRSQAAVAIWNRLAGHRDRRSGDGERGRSRIAIRPGRQMQSCRARGRCRRPRWSPSPLQRQRTRPREDPRPSAQRYSKGRSVERTAWQVRPVSMGRTTGRPPQRRRRAARKEAAHGLDRHSTHVCHAAPIPCSGGRRVEARSGEPLSPACAVALWTRKMSRAARPVFERPLDEPMQDVDAKGLEEIVIRSVVRGQDDRFDGAVGRHQNDGSRRVEPK